MARNSLWRLAVSLLATGLLLASCGTDLPRLEQVGLARVSLQDGHFLQNLAWSPDGSRLAATITMGGGDMTPASKIVVVDLSTGKLDVPLEVSNAYSWVQAWSPDGNAIAFAVHPSVGEDSLREGIWTIQMDGSGGLRFVGEGDLAAWSPDGKRMAIHDIARNPGTRVWESSIWILDLVTGDKWTAFESDGTFGWKMSWSPDGRHLAFAHDFRRSASTGLHTDIYVLDIETGALAQISRGGRNDFPTWSPDGRFLAYVDSGDRIGSQDAIIITRVDGSCSVQALQPVSDVVFATWSPDGGRIAFVGLDGLYLLDIATVLGPDFLITGPVCP